MFAALTVAASALTAPVPAPHIFVTPLYALTFSTPAGSTICALPKDWGGSDHGTVVFLHPPKQCGDVGYPSSGRSFSDDVPRIEVYYEYWLGDPGTGLPPCHKVIGKTVFMAKPHRLCQAREGQKVRISVSARYTADIDAWVEIALVTTQQRLSIDMKSFHELADSVASCKSLWSASDGKSFTVGAGPTCPVEGQFF